MFDFYSLFYKVGTLTLSDLNEACKWNCINKQQYKEITGEEYVEVTE